MNVITLIQTTGYKISIFNRKHKLRKDTTGKIVYDTNVFVTCYYQSLIDYNQIVSDIKVHSS